MCTGVFLFFIKRHLMSGSEFARSLGSMSENHLGMNTKDALKTLAISAHDNRPGVYEALGNIEIMARTCPT